MHLGIATSSKLSLRLSGPRLEAGWCTQYVSDCQLIMSPSFLDIWDCSSRGISSYITLRPWDTIHKSTMRITTSWRMKLQLVRGHNWSDHVLPWAQTLALSCLAWRQRTELGMALGSPDTNKAPSSQLHEWKQPSNFDTMGDAHAWPFWGFGCITSPLPVGPLWGSGEEPSIFIVFCLFSFFFAVLLSCCLHIPLVILSLFFFVFISVFPSSCLCLDRLSWSWLPSSSIWHVLFYFNYLYPSYSSSSYYYCYCYASYFVYFYVNNKQLLLLLILLLFILYYLLL